MLRIKSGTTVRIDTMSHQGLTTNADPVTYFGRPGIKPEEVLQDAKDIYAKVPRGKGLGVHVLELGNGHAQQSVQWAIALPSGSGLSRDPSDSCNPLLTYAQKPRTEAEEKSCSSHCRAKEAVR